MLGNFELQVEQRAVIWVRFTLLCHRFDTNYLLVLFNFVYFFSSSKTPNFEKWISFFVKEFKTICKDGTWTSDSFTEVNVYLSNFWWLLHQGHNLILPICYSWLLSSLKQNVESSMITRAYTGSCHA